MSNRIPSTSPDLNAEASGAIYNFDLAFGREVDLISGAIGIKEGNVFLTKAGVAAMTLALPIAGAQSAGGDDGRTLVIIDTTGHAHTVTTPASGLNAADHIATFGGTAGQFGELVAFNGSWWLAASSGVTLS
jgi:hypothetical protein